MENVTDIVLDELLTLHAEVTALRVMTGAGLSDDPTRYYDKVLADIDGFTLALPMTDKQRAIVRERLQQARDIYVENLRFVRPGGWRGVLHWVGRSAKRARLVMIGAPASPSSGAGALR